MKKRKWLKWVLILLILCAAGVYAAPRLMAMQSVPASAKVESHTVERGDVSVTITGSGMLEVKDTLDVKLPEGVKVEAIFVEAGDRAAKGDVLAVLDADSLEYRAAELSSQLTALDKQLGVLRLTSSINAPAKGRIKHLPAEEGDDVIEAVNEHGALAILSTDGLMQVRIATDSVLEMNDEVRVRWNGGSEDGTVVSRTAEGYLITLEDDKAPYLAEAAVYSDSVMIGEGVLEIHAPLPIFGNGGMISKVHYDLDAQVAARAKLFTLENEPATDDYRKALADRDELAAQLQTVLRYQRQPHVLAPEDCTVNEVLAADGVKTVSQDGTGEAAGFVLGVGGATKMIIDVDELDVGKVQVGQQAEITMDAFSSETFTATVRRISWLGKPNGSITAYETELELEADPRLRAGMNGSAVILSESVEDVVIVPLGAVHEDERGSYVYLLDEGDQQRKAYITTGLADAANAQVLSGLQAGDRIVYATSSWNFMMPPFAAMPGGRTYE